MSGKLDQSLDEILSTQRRTGAGAGARRRSTRRTAGRPATAAPVGGVQKTKQARAAATKQAPAKAAGGSGESKVVVSNLPKDVNEGQIKEYFTTSVGPIKRVELSYGPNSVSRGIATVTFHKPDGASRAFNALNGLLVDNRPIKIEIVVTGDKAAAIAPPAKTLTERISQPKAQPKSAADKKKDTAKASGAGARGRGGKKKARSGRPAKKTAEELDSEMADYFEASNQNENANAATTNGGAPAATNGGDQQMDDDIL